MGRYIPSASGKDEGVQIGLGRVIARRPVSDLSVSALPPRPLGFGSSVKARCQAISATVELPKL